MTTESEHPCGEPLPPGLGAGRRRHRDPVRGPDVRLLPRRLAQLRRRPGAGRGGASGPARTAASMCRANRAFLRRAVACLARAGRRPVPRPRLRHPDRGQRARDRARAVNPAARTVYVDSDAVAFAHGQALLADAPEAAFVHADLRDPEAVLEQPGGDRPARPRPAGRRPAVARCCTSSRTRTTRRTSSPRTATPRAPARTW